MRTAQGITRHAAENAAISDRIMQKKKDVLTTGEVARICNVAPRTVTKWFDSGQLVGYRIPGSRDRRIPVNELIRFMKAHNMPTESLDKGHMRVLVINSDIQAGREFGGQLEVKGAFEVRLADNSFEAGLMAEKFRPQVVFIDLMAGQIDAQQLCRQVREDEELREIKLVAIAGGLTDSEAQALVRRGFDAVLTRPQDADAAVKLIEQCCCVYS